MYEIDEKLLEIPKWQYKRKKYPFGEMEVGQSFIVPKADFNGKDGKQIYNNLMSACRQKRFKDMRFTGRVLDEGVRLWRIE